MSFDQKRRQVFLGEKYYNNAINQVPADIAMFTGKPAGSGDTPEEGWMISFRQIAHILFEDLFIRYTAGEAIEPLRHKLEKVVAAYERYGEKKWIYYQDRNEPVFDFEFLDDYCILIQLIGLCFLLHRRDLLSRIAVLQDGEDGHNGGFDTLYEEFMAYGIGPEIRYESDWLCWKRPYEPLFHALTESTPQESLEKLQLFLKHWYKDLSDIGWHDSHKPDEAGNSNGYFGYWSFEAGAAVLLLGIEDDSSLHQYLYYPKDLVAWAREHANLADFNNRQDTALRVPAGQPCLRTGYWFTPAAPKSRQRFEQGQIMPDLHNPAFDTIWQWDKRQD